MDSAYAAEGAHEGRPYSRDDRRQRYGGSPSIPFFSVSSVSSVARFSKRVRVGKIPSAAQLHSGYAARSLPGPTSPRQLPNRPSSWLW